MAKIPLFIWFYTSQVQDFWTINSSTSPCPCMYGIFTYIWLIFMGNVLKGNTPVPGTGMLCFFFAENCAQKPQTIRTWISMPNNCKCGCPRHFSASFKHVIHSMDLKVWESWIIGYVFHFYISAPPWKSLYLQNITQYNILRKTVENPQNRWSLLARDDHHCLTFQAFGWFFVSGGVSGSATVTCCALRVLFWTLQWDRVSLNLYNKGCFGPQNGNFWGVRILRVNNFLRQSVSPNFSLPDFPETLQMFTSQPFFYLVASIQLT